MAFFKGNPFFAFYSPHRCYQETMVTISTIHANYFKIRLGAVYTCKINCLLAGIVLDSSAPGIAVQ
jgi:hypothetical protein